MITLEHAFLHVVETGSFKKAAEHLGIESSSLSRKVVQLEKRLKVKLLHRSTLKTQPTELGRVYYDGLRRIIDDQLALEEKIVSGANAVKGMLRVGSTVDLGEKFIVPVLYDMQKEAPELCTELVLNSEFDNLLENNLDVAIRIGPLPDSSLIAKKLGEVPRILVAGAGYLEAHGIPEAAGDLVTHNFVMYSHMQANSDIEFLDGSRLPHSDISCNCIVNSARAIRALVLDGAGIHPGPRWLYEDDLAKGSAVQLLPSLPIAGLPVYAVYTARSFLPQKTREFIERLSAHFSRKNPV